MKLPIFAALLLCLSLAVAGCKSKSSSSGTDPATAPASGAGVAAGPAGGDEPPPASTTVDRRERPGPARGDTPRGPHDLTVEELLGFVEYGMNEKEILEKVENGVKTRHITGPLTASPEQEKQLREAGLSQATIDKLKSIPRATPGQ